MTFECDVCEDREGFIVKDNGHEFWRQCDVCFQKKKVRRLLKSSQITDRFRQEYTFNSFVVNERPEVIYLAYETARSYFKGFEKIITKRQNSIGLFGNPGSGKTHLLGAITNNFLARGIGVVYFPWVEGLNDLKGDWEKINTKVDQLKNAEVLFIDDLFKGRKAVTDWQLEQLFEIINYRYLNYLPIMVSSEKNIDQLMDIDEGIASRIYEMTKFYTVTLEGANLNYRIQDQAV